MSDHELIPAATVILARDGAAGPEVLMLRRNSKIAFGGMWVFPGGRVDPADVVGDDTGEYPGESVTVRTARNAAVREANEEAGLVIDPVSLVPWSYWVPPDVPAMTMNGPRRRFSTWFFLAGAPDGEVRIDNGEIHEHAWMRPREAMEQRNRGDIELAPPTFVTLHQLSPHSSVNNALRAGPSAENAPTFATKVLPTTPPTLAWSGDRAYPHGADVDATTDGPLNRLHMADTGWTYEQRS